MFFIFGFGHRKFEQKSVIKGSCQRCNNHVDKGLVKATSWFTLFFVPLVPYSTKYIIVCPICNNAVELPKEEFDRIVSGAANAPDYPEQSFAGKTPTQINYLKQMEEYERNKGE